MKKEYLIKASTVEDALENWIWINDDSINRFIKIINPKNTKSVVVFKRTIDNNFINFYDSKNTIKIKDSEKPIIVINEYYRKELEIVKNENFELVIKDAKKFDMYCNSNWKHPNPSVSLPYRMSVISFVLGLISLLLGAMSLF